MKKITIMGVPFLYTDQKQFVTLLTNRIAEKQKTFVVTANPEIVMKANEDEALMSYIQQATFVTADGIGVVKASRKLGTPLPERVTGFDTMVELLKIGNEKGYKIYLLGAQEETINKAVKKISQDYPNVKVVGYHHGYFDWEHNTIADEAASLKPDIIFVALGAPRQEKWIAENMDKFSHGVFIGVGGSFDVIAGTVKRAPKAWQKLNLEWLYRLIQQPSRWKRLLAIPKFAMKIHQLKKQSESKHA